MAIANTTTAHTGGLVSSAIPGRTDKINTSLRANSYVIPADIVSGLGEGNTLAGTKVLDKIFPISAVAHQKAKMSGSGEGNIVRKNLTKDDKPVIIAGGEYVVAPEDVQRLGKGDMKHGHAILDEFVLHIRNKTIQEMKKLKPPVGSKVKKK